MAVYNGEKYIRYQIKSILSQLNENDELVISYDRSSDGTYEIIEEFYNEDKRIKLVKGPSRGVVYNFQNAIKECNNDYIFLSDQDDVWVKNKVDRVIKEFSDPKVNAVVHDAVVVDENLNEIFPSFFNMRRCRSGILKNIFKNSYIGSCMAFRRSLKDVVLPFPADIPMHDQWIGILAEKNGEVRFIEDKLIFYRRHENNVSSSCHANIVTMIKWRYHLVKEYLKRCRGG